MTTTRVFDSRPAEFEVSLDRGYVLMGEWRAEITENEGGYSAVCQYRPVSKPATRDILVDLLISCRYTKSEEIAIMRMPDDAPEKQEHEAFVRRVKLYVDSVLSE